MYVLQDGGDIIVESWIDSQRQSCQMIWRASRAPVKVFLLVCGMLLFVSLVFYSDGNQRAGINTINSFFLLRFVLSLLFLGATMPTCTLMPVNAAWSVICHTSGFTFLARCAFAIPFPVLLKGGYAPNSTKGKHVSSPAMTCRIVNWCNLLNPHSKLCKSLNSDGTLPIVW